MKNLNLFFLFTAILIYSCNPSSSNHNETKDSLQQLLNIIRDSITKYPDDPRPRYNLAVVLQDAGRYAEALSVLDSMKVVKGDSTDPYVYFTYLFKRSELLQLSGDTVNAIRTLESFVIPGELTQAGLNLANLYAETNNPKAISVCDAMIKNDKEGVAPEPNYFKGIYYSNTGDCKKAIAEFDSSIKKDYTFLEAYLEKGICFYKTTQYADAVRTFDLALKVSNSFADAYYWKGKSQEAAGQTDEAKLNYLRAYGLDKTLTDAKEAADKLK